MVLSKAQANIMKDERGAVPILLGFLFFSCFFGFGLVVLDFMILKANMERCNDAVTAAGLAALGELNEEARLQVAFKREAA